MQVKAEIVAIGSELLLGQIVDTNSAWMAQRLADIGVNLFYKTVVGDNPGRMQEVISQALDRSDIVITSGGLGPTQDDITREIVAEVVNQALIEDPELIRQIEERFQRRGVLITPNNLRQALIPENAIPVANPNGTAPAFIVEDTKGAVICLPGVPFELKWLIDNEVVPYLVNKFNLSETITYRVLKVGELGESRVDDKIGHLIAESKNPTVGVLAHPGQVDVRIAAKAASKEEAIELIKPVEDSIRSLLGDNIFASDSEDMEDVVGHVLQERDVDVSTFEDLTGGAVAERVQRASIKHFAEGMINQRLDSLQNTLKLPDKVNPKNEVEHRDLTEAIAKAVKQRSGSDIGLAVHVVSEDSNKVENLAQGKTYISVTDGITSNNREYNYGGSGRPDRLRISLNAIDLLRRFLLNI